MTIVSIRIEDSDKKELDKIISEMGISLSTFYTIYTKKVIRDRVIPFTLEAPPNPFYSMSNMKQIDKSYNEYLEGKEVSKSLSDLSGYEK
ncbi:MAG: type II toxin-antitoxin system RelB/DinJ family antitoxin [Coprobacillus sp.]|nr:type II toxin-antitoxin system RelB/DinJ family antitoxin [Coprobacillus sp.]